MSTISSMRAIPRKCTFAGTIAAFVFAGSACFADSLIIQGSTTFTRQLMEPHRDRIESLSKHELTVVPNKSLPGLIALVEGRAHLAMISAPLEAEVELLRKAVPGLVSEKLQAFEILRTRISVAIHSTNPLRRISIDSVRKILLGEIRNWKELGGPDLPIKIVLVGGGGGVTVAVEAELLKGQRTPATNVIYVRTPIQLVQVVEQEIGAIGFAQFAIMRDRTLPELTTEKPIEQVLSLVTFGEPTAPAKAVIDAARKVAIEHLM